MKKLLYYCIGIVTILTGCSLNEDVKLHDNIREYQGVWRDTILSANAVYVEELIINDNSIRYSLSDASTHVVLDTLSGTLVVGNENKIGWNCVSPIDNRTRQTTWSVLSLSPYKMTLYSNTFGEHNYKKMHYSTIEEERIQDKLQNVVRDTLLEMLRYQDYLPLRENDLLNKFGSYNRLVDNKGISYYLHHSLFDKISFSENLDNDSIYSFTLFVKDWAKCFPFIESNYIKLRDVNATTEYIDSESLETSENVVITDPSTKQISFKPIKDYDYWPNMSRYMGKALQTFMDDYQAKFVYRFHENAELGLFEYSFQTHRDSICTDIFVCVDSNNIIKQSGVCLIKTYISSRKKEAQKELEQTAVLLNKKYFFDREGMDENGNKVYYYYPSSKKNDSPYKIKLRLRQYQNGITKIFQVAVNYILL